MEQNSLFASDSERRSALRHLMLMDHGFLRVFWTHEYEIAPAVWRSNQPSPARIAGWAARGMKSVLTLRGRTIDTPIKRLEHEACIRHGLSLHNVPLGGGALPDKTRLCNLLDCFASAEKPFVFHCKSGIDRTGLAAFFYLMAETDTPPDIARRQLSFKYLHLKSSRHAILDFMADSFLAAHRESGIGLRNWVEREYDRDALSARYGTERGVA